jgi:hypothetical protein
VVRKAGRGFVAAFIKGAQELEKEGVRAITTTCGFLALFQQKMAEAVNIPVFTSSLMQVPLVYAMLKPTQKVGIITINAESLTRRHLSSVGVDKVPHVIVGTEGEEEFSRKILDDVTSSWVQRGKRSSRGRSSMMKWNWMLRNQETNW